MRLPIIALCCLLATLASGQTATEIASKIDGIIKRTNGYSSSAMKVRSQSFGLNELKIEFSEDGKTGTIVFSKIPWLGFDYDIEPMESDKNLSVVEINFMNEDDEVKYKEYSNGKLEDDSEEDRMMFFIKSTDAKQIELELDKLYIATWPEMSSINGMSKQGLVNYLTTKLNAALKEDGGKVKSITECEMTFLIDGSDVVSMPTKNVEVHGEKEDDRFYGVFCYGDEKAIIKTNNDMEMEEHPDFLLDIDTLEKATVIQFALKCLSKNCR
ncbi:MAG TPA: hypothetical protein VLC98_08800 [Phnomibacter sp.]|nr:hypothetical protein [Phnomibacter sp.]